MPGYLSSILIAMAILLPTAGCEVAKSRGIKLIESPQRGIFYIRANWPFEVVVDEFGQQLVMPDGLKVIVESSTFESEVLPKLTGTREKLAQQSIRVDASIRLPRQSVVVGVVEDGGEVSRDYHVVVFESIYSVEWSPAAATQESER